jgi:hypothetical protein
MSKHRGRMIAIVATLLVVGGCATVQQRTRATEEVLSAAGFQMKPADTPEQLTTLRTLPPRTVVPQPRDGQVYYVYADPGACRCLYVGTEAQYQQYQRFELQQELADKQLRAAQQYWDATTTWGPWPW